MSDISNNAASAAAAQKRKQFWIKLATIALLLIVAVLKPKVEAWLANNAAVNDENVSSVDDHKTVDQSDINGGFDQSPGGLRPTTGVFKDMPTDSADSDIADPGSDAPANNDSGSGSLKITDPNKSAKGGSTRNSDVAIADAGQDSSVAAQSGKGGATSTNTGSVKPKSTNPGATKSSSGVTSGNPSGSRNDNKPGTSAKASNSTAKTNPDRNSASAGKPEKATEPPLGKLTLVNKSREEFQSTAGLMYVRGSEDGHRLKHVLQHAKDNLEKPVHGVFSGDREQITAWIDEAYLKGKKGGKGTKVEQQGGRTVYTVDLGKKIGYVGGQVGERKRNPECRFLRLVIQDGNEVVTAYPSQSL